MTGDPRFVGERQWAVDQLAEAEATPAETDLVLRMLEEWWSGHGVKADEVWRALGFFEDLARGKALPPPAQEDVRWRWEPARPGNLVVRDVVRVRADAYQGDTGRMHNGKQGRVVRLSAGDVSVLYDGDSGGGLPPRHSPHNLEKRYPA